MKTIIVIIVLLSAGVWAASFLHHDTSVTEITVLRDVTDNMLSQPNTDEILSLYGRDKDKWNGAALRFIDITDVSFNGISEVRLEAVNKWLSNEPARDKEIKSFKSKVVEILSSKTSIGKAHSSIYIPLTRELNILSQSKADRKIFLIYSDLMENSPAVSFYNKAAFARLQANPDSLKQLFEKLQPLHQLAGIEVYLIFQPVDVSQDEAFKTVSEFYKKMLEDKGAHVTISANL